MIRLQYELVVKECYGAKQKNHVSRNRGGVGNLNPYFAVRKHLTELTALVSSSLDPDRRSQFHLMLLWLFSALLCHPSYSDWRLPSLQHIYCLPLIMLTFSSSFEKYNRETAEVLEKFERREFTINRLKLGTSNSVRA